MDQPATVSGLEATDFGGVSAVDAVEMALPAMAPEAADPHFDQPVESDSLPVQADVSLAQPTVEPRREASTQRPAKAKGAGAVRRTLQLLSVLVLAAAGVAAGEYATMVGWLGPIAVHSAVEPVRLGIIGGLLGVLIAWVGIRWTTPKS
jgi:hypothetical protein